MRSFRFLIVAGLAASLGAQTLTVDDAVRQSLAVSGALQAKAFDVARAAAAVGEAKARLLPQVSLTGSASYMTNPPKGIKLTQGSLGYLPSPNSEFPQSFPAEDMVLVKDPEHTYFKISGQFEQVLFSWGKVMNAVALAELGQTLAATDAASARLDQAKNVRAAYFGAVMARDSAALLAQINALMRQIVADREQGLAQGTLTKLDVLQSKSQASQVGSALVKAEQGLASGLAALEFFTGSLPPASALVTPFREAPAAGPVEEDLVAQALRTSPQLARLSLQVQQARLGEKLREGSQLFLPDLAFNLGMDTTGQKIPFVGGNWTDTWSTNWVFSLGFKVGLFDGFSAGYQLVQATAQRQAAEAGAGELRRAVALQVRRAVEAVKTQAAEVERLADKVAAAEEQQKSVQAAVDNDAATREEARGATAALLQAKLELLTGRFQLETALDDLDALVGAGVP